MAGAGVLNARAVGVRVDNLVLAVLLFSSPTRANETDPWYAWLHPPRDGTAALNRAISERFARGLQRVNAKQNPAGSSCRDVAATMVSPVRTAALYFFAGDLGSWGVDYSPRSASELFDAAASGAYQHLPRLLPFDPAMRAGVVLFGTDKLGHFFTNGLRHYDRYRAARAVGASEDEALRAAITQGIAEERTWLGMYASGIFSYADLEANHQGVLFFRSLCEDGGLALVDGRWTLAAPFDIARWVSPCWDEAFAPSYFRRFPEAAKRGLAALCDTLDRESVRDRRQRYREHACTSTSTRVVGELVARGELPDPSPWSYEAVCTTPSAIARANTASADDRGGRSHRASLPVAPGARTQGR